MKIVVGLGNPGQKYQISRHNAGFVLLDSIAKQCGVKWKEHKKQEMMSAEAIISREKILLLKPQGFMNRSGEVLSRFLQNTPQIKSADLYVAHDDLDICLGEYKFQMGKGPHDHNGLISIYQNLSTKEFWHIRIGVDGRGGVRDSSGSEYVLNSFSQEEKIKLDLVLMQIQSDLKQQIMV